MKPLPDPGDLFERHHLAIFRYLWRVTGRREVAEDLAQDVFVRVLKGIDRYQARDLERAWLFKIARNLMLDRLRDAQRSPGEHPVRAIEPGDLRQGPMQEMALHLDQAVRKLDDLDRDVFLLREVGGLGYVEIAAVCDLSPDAVRSRICRARSALRVALGSQTQLLRQ